MLTADSPKPKQLETSALPRHFYEPAEAVRQLHLPRCAALRFEKRGARHDESGTAPARSGHVEAVERVKEFHPPWCILRRRRGHRIDDRRTGLTLKLVHRPNRDAERI